ncbi:hypothetical protein JEO88_01760 [Candidatus Saccharibacteria bacterium]|nr:hypothetical protein [Candidatus Saccharibacteria bacterium]
MLSLLYSTALFLSNSAEAPRAPAYAPSFCCCADCNRSPYRTAFTPQILSHADACCLSACRCTGRKPLPYLCPHLSQHALNLVSSSRRRADYNYLPGCTAFTPQTLSRTDARCLSVCRCTGRNILFHCFLVALKKIKLFLKIFEPFSRLPINHIYLLYYKSESHASIEPHLQTPPRHQFLKL